jgi:hypothetical protein
MKQLYFLLILTLSFGVYSQGVFTYNFDDTTTAAGFKTSLDANESSWGGDTAGDNDQKPAAAGYMGVIGTDADPTLYPGCVNAPGNKTNAAIYSQKYPNTTRPAANGGPAKSLGLNTGKVHLTVALQAWKITNDSGNEFEVRLQNPTGQKLISLKLQQHAVDGAKVAGQVRLVGTAFNGTTNGQQKTAGLFAAGSGNSDFTTPIVLGATVDFTAGTWEFWTDTTETTARLDSTQGGISGTYGDTGTNTTSISGETADAITVVVKRSKTVGADDYFIVDQIKVSGPNYIDTVNYTASVGDFMEDSFAIYPNPADNFVVLQNAKVGDNVTLFDVVGKQVRSITVESESQQVDISELKTGVYFARSNQLGSTGGKGSISVGQKRRWTRS